VLAGHCHVATHHARELPGDREPQAGAAVLLRGRRLRLGEFDCDVALPITVCSRASAPGLSAVAWHATSLQLVEHGPGMREIASGGAFTLTAMDGFENVARCDVLALLYPKLG
jgi:hypothetical protein